jgi:5'-methylthioadenosine phosphorylase
MKLVIGLDGQSTGDKALEFAIMTAPDKRDPAVLAKLDAVAGRVL